MKKLLTFAFAFSLSFTFSQNTFYTKGLKISECTEVNSHYGSLFREINDRPSFLSTFRVYDMFQKVNLYSYEFDITLLVVSIETETEFIGYSLYCIDQTGESAIVTINIDAKTITVWLNGVDRVLKEEFKIIDIK